LAGARAVRGGSSLRKNILHTVAIRAARLAGTILGQWLRSQIALGANTRMPLSMDQVKNHGARRRNIARRIAAHVVQPGCNATTQSQHTVKGGW
jgi:hypothetical protein